VAPRPGGTWLALAALAVLFTGLVLLSLALVLLRFVPLLLVAAAVVHVVSRRRRRIGRRERTAAPRQPVVERPAVDWPAAKARFARVRQEYAAFECASLAVLGSSGLADVSVSSTAWLFGSFALA